MALRDRFNAEKRFAEALWNFLICLKVEASSTSANSSQTWEKANDQIDRFCCLRLSCDNLSTGNDTCAASRAGRHGHASGLRLWPLQDTSWRCMRRQNHHPPCAPTSPQVRAMARRRLRTVGLLKRDRFVVKPMVLCSAFSRAAAPIFTRHFETAFQSTPD